MFIIVAGVLCAGAAAFSVQQALSRVRSGGPRRESVPLLLAMRDIRYGEPLVLNGMGANANVMFVEDWPKNLTPAGGITEHDYVTTRQMRANTAFVKHEPILESQVLPDDEFVPPDMVYERIRIDPDDVNSGQLRAGLKVDVLQMEGDTPTVLMRSVRIYALGNLDAQGRPVEAKDPEPTVFLLIKKADQIEFLRAKLASRFILVPASDPQIEGPLLVDRRSEQEARRKEALTLLEQGRALMQKQDYERALTVLTEAATKYPGVEDLSAEAGREAASCRALLAKAYCDKARRALEEEKDFAAATKWLDTVEKDFGDVTDVRDRVRQLRQATTEALAVHREQMRYQSLLSDLDAALTHGNLPRAEELLATLETFSDRDFALGEGVPAPRAALRDYGHRLNDVTTQFQVDTQVLEAHLKRRNLEQARAKLQEMKKAFPEHPGMEELTQKVAAAGGAGA